MLAGWLTRWHGNGEEHQYQFYRCRTCSRIVTWKRIRTGGCLCGSAYVKPAYLTFIDKARLLLAPWSV